MPVDRSLLPPLPGKPDWYVENAPRAGERPLVDRRPAREPRVLWEMPDLLAPAPLPEPAWLPGTSPLAAPAFPTVAAQSHGRGLKRVKALAGKLRH